MSRFLHYAPLWLVCVILYSCSTTSRSKGDVTTDMHTSQNSLDWAGVYSGDSALLALADDQSYRMEERTNSDSIRYETGIFSWDKDGRTILLSENKKTYWVQENGLALLDRDNVVMEFAGLNKENPELENVYWRLSEINTKKVAEIGSSNGREAHLRFDGTQKMVSGSSGCNRIFGGYESSKDSGTLQFKPLAGTRMMCPSMEVETAFTEIIEKVAAYDISAGVLTLKDTSGATLLRFERALSSN
jgi:heat shock protein HslJ